MIFNNRRVLTMCDEGLFLKFDSIYAKCQNRKRIKSELPQKLEASRMYHTGVAIGAELVRAAVDRQSFFKLREQDESADRRLSCSDQKSMVSARIASVDCARGKPADSVGLQPFAAKRRIEIAANILAEADHDLTSTEAATESDGREPDIVSVSSICEIVGARNVWNCTRSLVKRRSRVQSKATRSFFSKRGSLLR